MIKSFSRKIVRFGSLLALVWALNGCIYLVVGGIGALGGYVVSPDTVEGIITGHQQNKIWDTAVDIVSMMGVIEERNDSAGQLISKIQGTRVTITVMRMSESTAKLTVKARKAFVPKIKVAQDVYMKIVQSLSE